MDRTLEYRELFAKMPRGTGKPHVPSFIAQVQRDLAAVVRAARLTRRKIDHLATLVRSATIFSDPAQEISSLIQTINGELRFDLKPVPPSDHCQAMYRQAQAEIDETNKSFQHVLKLRSDSMREHKDRKEVFGKHEQRHRVPIFGQQQIQQLIPEHAVARADATADIEAQVQEIGSIFGRLTNLVREQDEKVERIEMNVEETAANVDSARNVLMNRLSTMNTTAKTAIKCGGIITATLLIYTIFVA